MIYGGFLQDRIDPIENDFDLCRFTAQLQKVGSLKGLVLFLIFNWF